MIAIEEKKLHDYYGDNIFGARIFSLLFKKLFLYDKIFYSNKLYDPIKERQLQEWVHLITTKDMPYQYILGEVGFLSVTIAIHPPILIPRPETEYMVDLITQIVSMGKKKNLRIIDYCAGSGCIGISLLEQFTQSHCDAFEINHDAVALAAKNALHNKVRTRYTIYKKDIFQLKKKKKYDIIISNPPYISWDDYTKLDTSVKQWEHRDAVTDKKNGCEFVIFLLNRHQDISTDCIIAIEICQHNALFLLDYAQKLFQKSSIVIVKDQYLAPRILLITHGIYKSLSKEILKKYELL
jgi:release factor glutamine methyltransferase